MTFRPRIGLLLLLAVAGMAAEGRVGATIGVGWFTAPTVSNQAEALRPSVALVLDGWRDGGSLSWGVEANNNLAYRKRSPASGPSDRETVWLTSGTLLVGRTVDVPDFPARWRLALGGGGVHVWNRLERGTQSFQQESWGPEIRLVGLWERECGRHGLVLIRVAGIYASTFRSPIEGTALRASGDWSRGEFSMGWSWRS